MTPPEPHRQTPPLRKCLKSDGDQSFFRRAGLKRSRATFRQASVC